MNTIKFYVVLGGDIPMAFKNKNEATLWAKQIAGYVTEEYLTREKYIEYTWESMSEKEWDLLYKLYNSDGKIYY